LTVLVLLLVLVLVTRALRQGEPAVRIVMFYHSLLSDWNHGNAHFLRGVVTELRSRGHQVRVYEPEDAWSRQNLVAGYGEQPIREFRATYPGLDSQFYDLATFDPDDALEGAGLVLVHEWSDHELVRRIGEHRASRRPVGDLAPYRLLFHDTHHRSVTDPESMAAYDLSHYDGVLAFGRVIRDLYRGRGWAQPATLAGAGAAWVWHEAADTRVFFPREKTKQEGDLVWIGNWGDEERTAELHEFLLEPVKRLGLKARVYGVRYPDHALAALEEAGIEYGGWLPNYRVPELFARYAVTVHVPRRPYTQALPGIPTIRVFEALACGIPLISAPWEDSERLFTPGQDYLVARDGEEMTRHLERLLGDEQRRREFAARGRRTILARHTCRHRVDELLAIDDELYRFEQPAVSAQRSAPAQAGSSSTLSELTADC
jgi:spore maturation protein CgeB